MQGSVLCYTILWEISDSLEGVGDKWKRGKRKQRERETDRRAASPTVTLALDRLGPYVGSAMYCVTLDRQG